MTYKEKDYRVFAMFEKDWALVTAGTIERFNSCTVGWGSLGNMWGDGRSTVTVYVHPARYTSEFLKENEEFTVSFLPKSQKRALAYMGTHSGRTENKAEAAGLTPVAVRNSVTYEEAELTFVCRKLYQHQFTKEDIVSDVQAYYASGAAVYPDGNGGWQPHIIFIGEILDVIDKR